MKKLGLRVGFAAGLGMLSAMASAQTADRVFLNANVRTAHDGQPTAEGVAVLDGRIAYVGGGRSLGAWIGPNTDVVDLGGATLLPGLTDAHAHLLGIGLRELTLNLDHVRSVADLQAAIAETAQAQSEGAIVGRGWIETGWPEDRFPNAADLDAVVADRPVVLTRADGHSLLANSAALAAAGITAQTEDPDGGQIVRDGEGRATGLLVDNAMALVGGLVDAPSVELKARAYVRGANVYAELGWTGVHNMSVSLADVALIEQLANDGLLPLRVYNCVNAEDAQALFDAGARVEAEGRVVTRGVKFYMDGALGSRGALLAEPYADADTTGLQLAKEAESRALMDQALAHGVQLCIHAIGDRANTLALDWMEAAFEARPLEARAYPEPRWRIEHAQIVDLADIPRFKALGVIASMQPSHAIGDLYFAPDRLGPDRLDGAYAWARLVASGAVIAGGSDAPVEKGDPRIELYAARVRAGLDGFQNKAWRPDQAVPSDTALKMFTLWPAYAAFQEDDLGSVAVGKKADFSVFDHDPTSVAGEAILQTQALMTVIDGDIVWRRKPSAG
ncbi:MAG: amidohydrolase [Maricaulaceae bacterium]